MWRIEGTVQAKKMRQDDGAEFISASFITWNHVDKEPEFIDSTL